MQASPYASYNQQPSANGCGGWLPIFAIIAIACLIVGYIQFHHFLVYQTYEQGRCTIQFGTVQTHSSKSGKSWTVDMGYTLSTQQGQQVAGTGYDLPATTFSSRADAQKIVESYPVGKQFPCWYNPQKPTSAALVLHSSSFLDFLRATFWFIPSAPGSRSATIPIILIMSDEAIAHSVLVPCCHCCSPLG